MAREILQEISEEVLDIGAHGSRIKRNSLKRQREYVQRVKKEKMREKEACAPEEWTKACPEALYVVCSETTLRGRHFPEGIMPINAQELGPEERLKTEINLLINIKQLSSPKRSSQTASDGV